MATKGGVTLDIPAFINLATQAKALLDNVTTQIDGMKGVLAKLREADIDGLSGGKGEEINAALETVEKMANEIRKLTQQIYIIAHNKATQMDEAYKAEQAKAAKEEIQRTDIAKK
jgi:hypothetical protein